MIREMCGDQKVGTFEVGLICRGGGMMREEYQAKTICHYLVVNWILLCIADPLEQCRFTSIRSPDNEDSEVGVPGSDVRSFKFKFSICHYR